MNYETCQLFKKYILYKNNVIFSLSGWAKKKN